MLLPLSAPRTSALFVVVLTIAAWLGLSHPLSAQTNTCGQLAAGSSLTPGQSISSCTGGYQLTHQTDGNVTLTRKVGTGATTTLWSTGTTGASTTRLSLFKNGGLNLFGPNNTVVWRTTNFGAGLGTTTAMTLGNDGALTITDINGGTIWFAGCGYLPRGASLLKGKSLIACDRSHTLDLQPDGNLVLYPLSASGATGTPIWNSETYGKDARRLTVTTNNTNGDLALIDGAANRLWTAFQGKAPKMIAGLLVRRDGSMVVRATDNTIIWTADATQLDRSTSENVTKLNKSDPWTWLIKSVCVDSSDKVVKVDPFSGCPSGTTIRKIRPGEPLPYWNFDQSKDQRHDAFPYRDPKTGTTVAVMPFDMKPHGSFNLFDGSDGYDIYGVRDGLVSGWNTQDGGGYSTTFFGANCTVGNGWVFFPESNFLSGGSRTHDISGAYWEQSGLSFPGSCPSGYGQSTGNWQLLDYTFGGKNGAQTKTMETMRAIHGFQDSEQFRTQGHLEVFYFTREYGITRWEVWKPVQQGIDTATACAGVENRSYNGIEFNVSDCRDWSNVTMPTTASIPVWPIPNFNVLKAAHFDDSFLNHWQRGGYSPAGNLINWSLKNSKNSLDTKYASEGVRFLATNCGAGADGKCGAPNTQFIWQDMPISEFVGGEFYGYGANLRLQQGANGTGTMRIAIQILDGSDKVLKAYWKDAQVTSNNGNRTDSEVIGSVYRTSKFVGDVQKLDMPAGAAKVRYILAPLTPHTFEVVNAWLAPWPKATASFGTIAGLENTGDMYLTGTTVTESTWQSQLAGALGALTETLRTWLNW